MSLEADNPRSTLLLVGFVLVVVAGVIATVAGLQNVAAGEDEVPRREMGWSIAVLILGLLTLGAAALLWLGHHELAGALAVAASIVFLVQFPELAGVLGLVGGVLALVADRAFPLGRRHLYGHRVARKVD